MCTKDYIFPIVYLSFAYLQLFASTMALYLVSNSFFVDTFLLNQFTIGFHKSEVYNQRKYTLMEIYRVMLGKFKSFNIFFLVVAILTIITSHMINNGVYEPLQCSDDG